MTLLYSFVFNNFCSESLSGDQTPNAQPPANFRLRRWQRKRDSAIELPIRRQRVRSLSFRKPTQTAYGFPAGPVRGFSGRISLSHGRSSLSRGRISLSLSLDHSFFVAVSIESSPVFGIRGLVAGYRLRGGVLQMSITASNKILQRHFFFASKRQRLF
jgi:hypothetical protein